MIRFRMADDDSDTDSFHSETSGGEDPKSSHKLHVLIWENDYSKVASYIRSDSFEMFEFERIDPRGRTPLHLGELRLMN